MSENVMKYKKRLEELRDETKLSNKFKIYRGFTFFRTFDNILDQIEKMQVKDDDVWVTSFPKSGTTWTQEMVWLIANNFDYNGAKVSIGSRYCLLEAVSLFEGVYSGSEVGTSFQDPIVSLRETQGKRFVKTHLPWEFLPTQIKDGTRKPKIIHIIRDPKDICVSYFHHMKIVPDLCYSLEDFFNKFITDKFHYSPYWDAVLSYWNKRDLPNVLIIKYEDMIHDIKSVISTVVDFLGTSATKEQIEKLSLHLNFEQMKNNSAVNVELLSEALRQCGVVEESHCMMRKGKIGSHKDDLTDDMINLLNVWSKINTEGHEY